MEKNKVNNFMAIINKVPPIISFISLIIGICLTLITIPKACSEKNKLDREAWESQPKFEAYFLDMPFNMYFKLNNKDKDLFKLSSENYPIWKYPIVKNDVHEKALKVSEEEKLLEGKEAPQKDGLDVNKDDNIIEITKSQTSNKYFITLLVIEQKGKRKADDVSLNVDQAIPNEGLELFTAGDLVNIDYLDKFKDKSTFKNIQIMIGNLDAGQGVMIPLSIRKAVTMSHAIRYIISERYLDSYPGRTTVITIGNVYFPKKVFFKDSYDHKTKEYEIRKMLDIPIILSPDIEIRG